MIESIRRIEINDDKGMEMENDSFVFDRKRAAAQNARHRVAHSSVGRGLNVEERRLDLESSKRRGRIEFDRQELQIEEEERKAMIDLLKMLADKQGKHYTLLMYPPMSGASYGM